MTPPRIAISKASPGKYALYIDWLRRADPSVLYADLSTDPNPLHALADCDALLLTGGGDVDPSFYHAFDPEGLCTIDRKRDEFEFFLIRFARDRRLPILGICRGAQILNVAFGGALHIDLPSLGFSGHQKWEGEDVEHPVTVVAGSRSASWAGTLSGSINSAHHQAVSTPAPGFRVTATSNDGVAEAIEWEEPEGKPYLLGVQWHPERMRDEESPFSRGVAENFLDAVRRGEAH